MSGRVLVVDDDPAVGLVLGALLRQAQIECETVTSGAAALEVLRRRPCDVVVSDVRMPGMDGMELLSAVRALDRELPVVLLTAHGSVPLAVEAMRRGAADFVLKPFDRDELLFVVKKALRSAEASDSRPPTADGAAANDPARGTAMLAVEDRVRRAAQSDATVLLTGESGTGKERIARGIHEASKRRSGPFIAVHCAALPEALLESELFGHEKGAFTGATSRKPGRVELAEGGTLLLDEIGDVPAAIQVKLLRILQERTYERLGGTQTLKADVRFVAATHRDLNAMVTAGTFREDLFYRLNVVPIHLPPLRDRREEIAPLVRHFCEAHAKTHGRAVRLDDAAIAVLEGEAWSGNVRQLQNFVERLVVLAEDDAISAEAVRLELERDASRRRSPDGSLDALRKRADREALVAALAKAGDNRTLAARILGVSRRTLYNMLHEQGLT